MRPLFDSSEIACLADPKKAAGAMCTALMSPMPDSLSGNLICEIYVVDKTGQAMIDLKHSKILSSKCMAKGEWACVTVFVLSGCPIRALADKMYVCMYVCMYQEK